MSQQFAASVGMNSSTRDLDYGIDLTLLQVTSRTNRKTGKTRIVESGLTLNIQIKSNINAITEADCVPLRMEDLALLLSELEERPAVEIANDIARIHRRDES
jgi:hypothetical protein